MANAVLREAAVLYANSIILLTMKAFQSSADAEHCLVAKRRKWRGLFQLSQSPEPLKSASLNFSGLGMGWDQVSVPGPTDECARPKDKELSGSTCN